MDGSKRRTSVKGIWQSVVKYRIQKVDAQLTQGDEEGIRKVGRGGGEEDDE